MLRGWILAVNLDWFQLGKLQASDANTPVKAKQQNYVKILSRGDQQGPNKYLINLKDNKS